MTIYKTIADENGGTQVAMTADEEDAFLAAQSAAASSQAVAATKGAAQFAIDHSSITLERIQTAVAKGRTTYAATDVQAWVDYHESLRPIIKSGIGPIPTQPAYPQGT